MFWVRIQLFVSTHASNHDRLSATGIHTQHEPLRGRPCFSSWFQSSVVTRLWTEAEHCGEEWVEERRCLHPGGEEGVGGGEVGEGELGEEEKEGEREGEGKERGGRERAVGETD